MRSTEIGVASAAAPAAIRDNTAVPTRGRPFVKGHSGNPTGRPRRDHDVAALAREHTQDAIRVLASIMTAPKAPPSARVAAARALLDRGWGKAPQSLDVNQKLTLADEFEALIRELSIRKGDGTGTAALEHQGHMVVEERNRRPETHHHWLQWNNSGDAG